MLRDALLSERQRRRLTEFWPSPCWVRHRTASGSFDSRGPTVQALGCRNAGVSESWWMREQWLAPYMESGERHAGHTFRKVYHGRLYGCSLAFKRLTVCAKRGTSCLPNVQGIFSGQFHTSCKSPHPAQVFFFWPDHHSAARSVASSRNSVSCLEAKCKTRNSKLSWQILGKKQHPKTSQTHQLPGLFTSK